MLNKMENISIPPKDYTNYMHVVDDVELTPLIKLNHVLNMKQFEKNSTALMIETSFKRYNLFGDDETQLVEKEKNIRISILLELGVSFLSLIV